MRLTTLPLATASVNPATVRSTAAMNTVVYFDALKGMLGLLAALMLVYAMQLSGAQVDAVFANREASTMLDHCLKMAVQLTGTSRDDVAMLFSFSLLYSAISFIEAYGLWRSRTWAKWLAVLSGTIFIPSEILNLLSAPTISHLLVLVLNVAIVAYMLYSLRSSLGKRVAAAPAC